MPVAIVNDLIQSTLEVGFGGDEAGKESDVIEYEPSDRGDRIEPPTDIVSEVMPVPIVNDLIQSTQEVGFGAEGLSVKLPTIALASDDHAHGRPLNPAATDVTESSKGTHFAEGAVPKARPRNGEESGVVELEASDDGGALRAPDDDGDDVPSEPSPAISALAGHGLEPVDLGDDGSKAESHLPVLDSGAPSAPAGPGDGDLETVTGVVESGLVGAGVAPVDGELSRPEPLAGVSQSVLNDDSHVDAPAEPSDTVPMASGLQDSGDGEITIVRGEDGAEGPIPSVLVSSAGQDAELEVLDIGQDVPSTESDSQDNDMAFWESGNEAHGSQTKKEEEEEEEKEEGPFLIDGESDREFF
jgi:hypothetical protein